MKSFEAKHYLLRGKSASDARKQTLNLTAPGRQALVTAQSAVREHEKWLKARFSEAEVAQLIALLTRIHE